MQPAVFVSHGAPTVAIEESEAREFLSGYGLEIERRFGRPRAIVVASAHWETAQPAFTTAARHETIHDFGGFPRELYEMRYPAPGAPDVVERASALLRAAGFEVAHDPRRGLDHGAWIPLRLMFPEADVSVTQLSLQTHLGAAHHLKLGEVLRPLREEGVLVFGSGQVTHNLGELRRGFEGVPPHIAAFVEWLGERAAAGDREALVDYRRQAPHAERNHPTDEHLLPFHFAFGAAGGALRRVHASATFGFLRMDAFESA